MARRLLVREHMSRMSFCVWSSSKDHHIWSQLHTGEESQVVASRFRRWSKAIFRKWLVYVYLPGFVRIHLGVGIIWKRCVHMSFVVGARVQAPRWSKCSSPNRSSSSVHACSTFLVSYAGQKGDREAGREAKTRAQQKQNNFWGN